MAAKPMPPSPQQGSNASTKAAAKPSGSPTSKLSAMSHADAVARHVSPPAVQPASRQ